MFPAVAFVFALQSTGSVLCEYTTSYDAGFHTPSKFSASICNVNANIVYLSAYGPRSRLQGREQLTEQATTSSGSTSLLPFFTALHVIQTRYSDENSVRPSVCPFVCTSVCPSHAWIVTKR